MSTASCSAPQPRHEAESAQGPEHAAQEQRRSKDRHVAMGPRPAGPPASCMLSHPFFDSIP